MVQVARVGMEGQAAFSLSSSEGRHPRCALEEPMEGCGPTLFGEDTAAFATSNAMK